MLTSVGDAVPSPGSLLLVMLVLAVLWTRRRPAVPLLPLPPGPHSLPLIGNLLDMPTKNMAPTFLKMSQEHGDIVSLNVLGGTTVVLGSYDAAVALLESRSAHTSDRPRLVMAELAGVMWEFSVKRYAPTWRSYRRTFHRFFHRGAVQEYYSIHLRECKKLLSALLDAPEDFLAHTHRVIGGSVMNTIYGIDVTGDHNKYVAIAEKGARIFSEITAPGRFIVELLPWLAHIPTWFPGAHFKRITRVWKEDILAVRNVAFDAVVESMAQGRARPCMTHSLMEHSGIGGEANISSCDEEHYRDVTGVAYVAGVDTTYALMAAFFLALAKFPETQRRAQAELDAVVGQDRLPDFSDRDSLPYVNAILKECVRWHSILPLGLPHATTHEEIYDGYRIPAGSVLVPNAWAMAQDPVAYPNPERFMPERFLKNGQLDPDVRDPFKFQFGFGRRMCPGRHFALDSAFLMIASILHVFTIEPPVNDDGSVAIVDPRIPFDSALSRPEPFACRIVPRSLAAEALIRAPSLDNVI
ncbi:CyP450 monooxygenase [Dichomitus squalens]|uniref:CyP450 monooxygenase n=1 Tax=Dichomitus squalens TaxID=114155 RepID=A0A4Q9ML71_9APHY|nr:CyP450 monooxygenase [Dichomitus squalens]TBU44881.1 CyP450 monooxygenase [Dichomitus squalens]